MCMYGQGTSEQCCQGLTCVTQHIRQLSAAGCRPMPWVFHVAGACKRKSQANSSETVLSQGSALITAGGLQRPHNTFFLPSPGPSTSSTTHLAATQGTSIGQHCHITAYPLRNQRRKQLLVQRPFYQFQNALMLDLWLLSASVASSTAGSVAALTDSPV